MWPLSGGFNGETSSSGKESASELSMALNTTNGADIEGAVSFHPKPVHQDYDPPRQSRFLAYGQTNTSDTTPPWQPPLDTLQMRSGVSSPSHVAATQAPAPASRPRRDTTELAA